MITLTNIATVVGIIGWIILSVFPGLYLTTMMLGAPNALKNTIVRVLLHIIYSVVIGFISELLVVFAIICLPFVSIRNFLRKDSRLLKHLGYQMTMDPETGNFYAYNPETGKEVDKELNTRDYSELIAAIERQYSLDNNLNI